MRTEGSGRTAGEKRISLQVHWAGLIFLAMVGIVGGAVHVAITGITPQQFQKSVLIGVTLGLPYAIYHKVMLRRKLDFCVNGAVNFAVLSPRPKRSLRREAWLFIPMLLVFEGEIFLTLGHFGPAFAVTTILLMLTIPEQRVIWQKANEKLAEIKKQDSISDAG